MHNGLQRSGEAGAVAEQLPVEGAGPRSPRGEFTELPMPAPMQGPTSNVCVIGGGPAGLAAAIALRQTGCLVTLADRAVPPVDKACGEGLLPDSVAVLKQLGVTLPADCGFRFRGIRFSDAYSSVAADFPSGPGFGVRRVLLHDLLFKRADELGVRFHWGAKSVRVQGSQVSIEGQTHRFDFVVGADGQSSSLRRAWGLHAIVRERRRYGFRRHYRLAPWSSYMELHWGPQCQIYVTPVAADEICVVSMSRSPKVRLDDALLSFPDLRARLSAAQPASRDMGALSVSRKLRRVCGRDFALIGDASGSVDAITGEGLCLSFKQALSLADAVRAGRLCDYQTAHRSLARRPQLMSSLMLTLEAHAGLQRRALASLAFSPQTFASFLAVHVGAGAFYDLFSWQSLRFCQAFLQA